MMNVNSKMPEGPMNGAPMSQTGAAPDLWYVLDAHVHLLDQILDLVQLLARSAPAGYAFSYRIGPHLRHILEHYTALFDALRGAGHGADRCVDYDARSRNRLIESNPDAARMSIQSVQQELARGRNSFPRNLATPLVTRLTSGPMGEVMLTVPTSLGRELLFLESHTIHHMALLAEYVRGLGIALDADFGKAPATIAYERKKRAGH